VKHLPVDLKKFSMKNKYFIYIVLITAIIMLYFSTSKFGDHNLKKTISACVVAQKQTSANFDREKAKKFCEEEIKKRKNQ